MRRTGRRGVLVLVTAVALVATACPGEDPEPVEDPAAPRTFTYAVSSEVMIGWDPASGYSNEVIAMHNIYETLTRYDPDTEEVVPVLAESWEVSDDGLEWTYTLREGVTFHTGRELTAEAAKDAIERTMELGEAASYIFDAVEEIETPDDRTLVFRLSYPSPLDVVTSATYSAYIYDTEAAGDQDLAEWFAEGNDAGTGPYMVEEYSPGEEIELRLEAYPDYWGGWEGSHYDRYVFRVTPEVSTAAQLLRAREVTMVDRLSPHLWQTFVGQEAFQATTAPSWQTLLGLLNTQKEPLDDERVRHAVSLAVDYDGIMAALEGAGEPLSGYVPPGLWGHTEGLALSQDMEEARRLLDEAGYGPDGESITVSGTGAVSIVSSIFARIRLKREYFRAGRIVSWHDLKARPHEGTLVVIDHLGSIGRHVWWVPCRENDEVLNSEMWLVIDIPFCFVTVEKIRRAIPDARVKAYLHCID
jgi:peptide/nickel transport system substrate-binding protein